MYYKKQGNTPPIIKSGCVYAECYFYDGYLFFKYYAGNIPSEELTEITQVEYEINKPIIPEPDPTPSPEDIISAANTAKLNEILLLLKGVM